MMKFTVSDSGKHVTLTVDVLGVPMTFYHVLQSDQYNRDPKAAIIWAKAYLANVAGSVLTNTIKEHMND